MSEQWRPDQGRSERVARAVQSMSPGTLGGRVAQASQVRLVPRHTRGVGEIIEVPFSHAGTPQAGEESPPYFNRTPLGEIGTVIATTSSSTGGPTVIKVLVNGSIAASLTLPAGARQSAEELVEDVVLDYGDQVSVQTTSVGSGLTGLVVQVLIEG